MIEPFFFCGNSGVMEAYKRWIRRNKDFVRQFDSLANNFTWFLPDEFAESEIGPEAGFVKFW